MALSEANEFFLYDPTLTDDMVDFTDDRVFSPAKRKEYLKKYADYLEKIYPNLASMQKVVSREEIDCEMEKLKDIAPSADEISFGSMDVTLRKKAQKYAGWHLYTSKLSVYEDSLSFGGNGLAPTPAAIYEFDGAQRVTDFSFSFRMEKEYAADIPGGVSDVTPGRTVELRHGVEDVIKLQFYSNGLCYARSAERCRYHLDNHLIGVFEFDVWQRVDIHIGIQSFEISLNGQPGKEIPLSSSLNPDCLFVSSGMFQVGNWQFRPQALTFSYENITAFFCPADTVNPEEKTLGERSLPFVIGNFENRDMQIVLKKEFNLPRYQKAVLCIESLDPSGTVWLNGSRIFETDSFESIQLDITPYLKSENNLLIITVNPRAPEVLFNWHRQRDPYNGWFCGRIKICLIHKIEINNVQVLPFFAEKDRVKARISGNVSKDANLSVFLQKQSSEKTERILLDNRLVSAGDIDFTLDFYADLWTPENPNMYAVTLQCLDSNGRCTDEKTVITGFRTICQKNGELWLNGERITLTGALLMQFLPPHTETSTTHICPRTEQIVEQFLMAKKMNCNTVRLHILGYGTNDSRYAEIADRMGLMLIWITRYIDSVEQMAYEDEWRAKDGYIRQITEQINHPSIIMWEGANEFHPTLGDIDRIYKNFVPPVKAADPTRLICPVSHLYYAGDIYHTENCSYYNDSGTMDYLGHTVQSVIEWNDEQVVRSAHTYAILLGYGTGWDRMRKQSWKSQNELCASKNHAYIVSEFAVIGRQNPNVPEAAEYYNPYSYEFSDEKALGFSFCQEEWRESQAYQAMAAKADMQMLWQIDADGMLWCCLMGGANDGGYLKPPIDNYGYPKAAFFVLQETFQKIYVISGQPNAVKNGNWVLSPTVYGTEKGKQYLVGTQILNNRQECIAFKEDEISGSNVVQLPSWKPKFPQKGFYSIRFKVSEKV